MKHVLKLPVRIALMLVGFILILNLPILTFGTKLFNFNSKFFWTEVNKDIQFFVHFADSANFDILSQLPLFESYRYSMSLLAVCLMVVIFAGLLLAFLVIISPRKIRNRIKKGINLIEGIPDLFVIFLFMFFVITLYQKTGLKFLQLYGVFGNRPYFVPIVTISFLPTLLFVQFLIKVLEEEESKIYVLFGKAKGIGRMGLLFVHLLPNILPQMILQLRTSIWIILSNIYLIEFIFNIPGFTKTFELFLFRGGNIAATALCLLLFTLPLLIMEALGFAVSRKIARKERFTL
ncbi:ABC transporter permease subunit [Bacillus sp. FJAT-29814]|uniref:ABC transporter permease subunit n=1 Tax=Bacillus sp. FJAT-29814 TaxID=1729688 RepID=UPI00082E5675|nr:ABC transporter permease subunit [Bacillus sp. FJAT-29814]